MQDVVLRGMHKLLLLQVAELIGGLAMVVFAVLTTAAFKKKEEEEEEEEEEEALVPGEHWQPQALGPLAQLRMPMLSCRTHNC